MQSKMGTRPTFVFVSAKTCPACVKFRSAEWSNLQSMINNSGLVNLVEIELPNTGSTPDTKKYPADLNHYIQWFPTFILVRNWTMTPGVRLDAVVYNSTMDPTTGRIQPSNDPASAAAIMEWIRSNLVKRASSITAHHQVPIPPLPVPTPVPSGSKVCGQLKIRAKNSN